MQNEPKFKIDFSRSPRRGTPAEIQAAVEDAAPLTYDGKPVMVCGLVTPVYPPSQCRLRLGDEWVDCDDAEPFKTSGLGIDDVIFFTHHCLWGDDDGGHRIPLYGVTEFTSGLAILQQGWGAECRLGAQAFALQRLAAIPADKRDQVFKNRAVQEANP